MPDGTQYPACTTMQTVYWPSSNTAALTVEPPSTTATADPESTATEQQESTKVEIPPGKTPEQLEQEAKDKGWLKVWHQFTWWFPWYRIHFVFKYGGIEMYDQGISALPFVGATLFCSDAFLNMIKNLWSLVVWPVACSVAGAEFTALLASNAGPTGFVAALLISVGIKLGSFYANWNSIGGLAGAFIGNVFATVIGMLKWTWSFVADFLKLLVGLIDLAEFGFGNLYRILSFLMSIAYLGKILERLEGLGAFPR
jgi:hypothetical protein